MPDYVVQRRDSDRYKFGSPAIIFAKDGAARVAASARPMRAAASKVSRGDQVVETGCEPVDAATKVA